MEPLITSMDLPGYSPAEARVAARLASGVVRGYCGWHIAPVLTEELTVEGRGGYVLQLPTLRLTAVTALAQDGDTLVLPDTTWSRRGVLRWSEGRWLSSYGAVVVTITHGYDETPDDVAAVATSVARRALANPESLGQESVAGYSATFPLGGLGSFALTPAERNILGRHRLPGRP